MCETTPSASMTLEKSLESPAVVRNFVEENICPEHGVPGMVALQLLASELVTNAVLYGSTPIRTEIHCEVRTLRVEVHDAAQDGAVLEGADGMGLLLVDKVAHEWGITVTETGKTVWATVPTGFVPRQAPSWGGLQVQGDRTSEHRTVEA